MKVTREEADALVREFEKRAAPRMAQPASPDLLRQAQVATEKLTGLPEWDVFLQRIQAWIDDERQKLAAMAEHMPPSMTSEQVLQAHRHIIDSRAKVEAWEQVLALPKALLSPPAGTQQAA